MGFLLGGGGGGSSEDLGGGGGGGVVLLWGRGGGEEASPTPCISHPPPPPPTHTHTHTCTHTPRIAYLISLLIPLVFLTNLRSLNHLAPFSLAADFANIFAYGIVFYFDMDHFHLLQ